MTSLVPGWTGWRVLLALLGEILASPKLRTWLESWVPPWEAPKKSCEHDFFGPWLDRQDSNLRMLGPKPSALPLGDGPLPYLFYPYFPFPSRYVMIFR